MPFDFFDGLELIADLLSLGNNSGSSSDNKIRKNTSKYAIEIWSEGFLISASILFFLSFKDPVAQENFFRN